MALTLQDLFVSLDAGLPQPGSRANAPAHKGQDSFDALFAASAPRTAPTRAEPPAAQRQPAAKRTEDNAPSTSSRSVDTAKRPSNDTKEPTAQSADASRPTDTQRDTDTDESTRGNTGARGASRAADDSTGTGDEAAAATANEIAPALTNLFQVTLLTADTQAATTDGTDVAVATSSIVPSTSDAPKVGAADTALTAALADDQSGDAPLAAVTTDATKAIGAATQRPDTLPNLPDASAHGMVMRPSNDELPAVIKAMGPATPQATPATPQAGDIAIVAAPAPTAPTSDTDAAAPAAAQAAAPQNAPAGPQIVLAAASPQAAVAAAEAAQPQIAAQASQPSAKAAAHADASTTKDATKLKDAPPAHATASTTPAADVSPLPTVLAAGTTAAVPLPDSSASATPDTAGPTRTDALATPPIGLAANPQAHQVYAEAAGRTAGLPQVTIDQVAMHLTKAAADGVDHLTIHLKPEQLGAIEVKLEMRDDGIAKATISADRADTLDLLQRDSHRLERALENAGLKADTGSLSFNLRDGGNRYLPYSGTETGGSSPRFVNTEDAAPVGAAMLGYLNARAARGGVDIRV